ncbi:MAG: C25 family cysteine peptidase [Planctomycetota bacterium]|nr:C25 family cysteine peptidase [Planctomycetota bacterium]
MRCVALLLAWTCVVSVVPTTAVAEEDETTLVGRVRVEGDGCVRLTSEALRALGVAHATHVEISRRGKDVPICAASAAEGVVFLAIDTATSLSRSAVYEIRRRARPRTAIAVLTTERAARDAPPSLVPVTRVFNDDRYHSPLPTNWQDASPKEVPTWFLARTPPGGDIEFPIDVGPAVGIQRISAHVFSTHRGSVRMFARLGSERLGIASAEEGAYGGAWFTWTLGDNRPPRWETVLHLRDRTDELPPPPTIGFARRRGWLWVDEIRIEGDVEAVLDERLRSYPMPPEGRLTLDVRPRSREEGEAEREGWCVLVDPAGSVRSVARVPAAETGRVVVRVDDAAAAPARLYVTSRVRTIEPEPAAPVLDPFGRLSDVRHVIIATPELVAPSRDLARHRTDQGLPSAVVDVTDVYAAYAHGESDPRAIRRLIRRLRARPDVPLEYVLLVGDATHDRADGSAYPTIPALTSRTQYNGATPSDWRYVLDDAKELPAAPAVGRLPFRRTDEMVSYVRRLIEYETRPPTGSERRLLRFLAGSSNLNQQLDEYFELAFSRILQLAIPLAYDVEVTYADRRSVWYWPLQELSRKIVEDANQGALFFTYVGHGYVEGFIEEQAWDMGGRIFELEHARAVAIRGTPPVFIVFACSTAAFDLLYGPCIGEVLLAGPSGPLAYYGASGTCHPVFHILAGYEIAQAIGRSGLPRVGDILKRSLAETLAPTTKNGQVWQRLVRGLIRGVSMPEVRGLDVDLNVREGALMYQLLGDPALRVASPKFDLSIDVELSADGTSARVVASADLPDDVEVHVTLERERTTLPPGVDAVPNADQPAQYGEVRRRHRLANTFVLSATTGRFAGGRAEVRLSVPKQGAGGGRVVKAWAVRGHDVHVGAAVLPVRR